MRTASGSTRTETNCTPGPVGYYAGAGYSQVTGIGSVNASALMTAWAALLGQHSTPPATGSGPSIAAITDASSYSQSYAPGEIVSIFGSQLASSTQAATSVPLPKQMAGVTVTINGLAAPLYYVSSGQLNVQVPYETPVGTSVPLEVTNDGQSASTSLVAAAAAPGIFVSQGAPVPDATAAQGNALAAFPGSFRAVQAEHAEPHPGRRTGPPGCGSRLARTGIGRALFRDAARRVAHAADAIRIRGIVVHAISEQSQSFYVALGFEPSPGEPMMLMVTLADVRAALL